LIYGWILQATYYTSSGNFRFVPPKERAFFQKEKKKTKGDVKEREKKKRHEEKVQGNLV